MKILLIVVDFQNDFVDGALGFPAAEALDQPICAKIRAYQEENAEVVFTFDTHEADYLTTQEGQKLPVEHCIKGSKGWQLYGKTATFCTQQTRCFEKPTFASSDLMRFVAEGGYQQVELCGLVSNICILSNAVLVKAALPEARIIVDARCTDSFDAVLHQKALDVLEGIQVSVINRM